MRGTALRGSVLVVVLVLVSAALAWPSKKDESIEAQLARWVTAQGGKLKGFKVGRECPTCLRGIVATKDFKPGDVIMKVPFKAVMRLKDLDYAGFPSEYARDLLDAMHNDPSHNETWDLFWSAHPGPDEVLTPEIYTDEMLAMLQTPELESLLAGQRTVAEQVYDGSYPYRTYKPFKETVPEDKVSLDTFKYVSAVLGSRYFGFYRDGNLDLPASHLVPMVDLINHSDDPNAERSDDSVNVLVKAVKPIKKGQEITNSYQPGVIHRPDMSLYIYGFVIPRERPFMAAVDLPNYNSSDPFAQSSLADDFYDDPNGKFVSQAEYERLDGLLKAAPTTEAEDQAQLDSGSVTDWRTRVILQYRVMRKRALRLALEKLGATLEAAGGGSGAAAAEKAEQEEEEADDEEEEAEEAEELKAKDEL